MKIRLSPGDRERFGCPEWLEFTLTRLAAVEAGTIQARTGYAPDEMMRALKPQILVRDAAGALTVWTPTDDHAALPAGAHLKADYDAWTAVIWVALRRAGLKVSWEEAAEFDVFGFTTEPSDEEREPEPDPGKALAVPSILPTGSTA